MQLIHAKGKPLALPASSALCVLAATLATSAAADIPRTESGKPDLSGYYDGGSLTPLERPRELADKEFLTPEEAAALSTGTEFLERRSFERPEPAAAEERRRRRSTPSAPATWAATTRSGSTPAAAWSPSTASSGRPSCTTRRDGRRPAYDAESHDEDGGQLQFVLPRQRRHGILAGPGRTGALRRAGRTGPGRAVPARLQRRAADASRPLQQLQAHRAERGERHDPRRDGPRRAHRAYERRTRTGRTFAAGSATRSATGRATPSSSTPRTSARTPAYTAAMRTCTSSSASRSSKTATCSTTSPWTTRRHGPGRGAGATCGSRPTSRSTSTPATKATTRWATSCAALSAWSVKNSPAAPRRRPGRSNSPNPGRCADFLVRIPVSYKAQCGPGGPRTQSRLALQAVEQGDDVPAAFLLALLGLQARAAAALAVLRL